MQPQSPELKRREISVLLRGEPGPIRAWTEQWSGQRLALHVFLIVAGAGVYGAVMGWWRDPRQALYTAIKFPMIVLLTTIGNALINGMLAPLLGLNIPFRQSFLAILMSFSMASLILGSFGPLAAFMVWNTPPLTADVRVSGETHSFILLVHVSVIAFAGVAANLRLMQLLRNLGGSATVARRVLFAWLAGNLFFGSQLSWILRPFIGSPGLPVQFMREDKFRGNFYETIFYSIKRLLTFD